MNNKKEGLKVGFVIIVIIALLVLLTIGVIKIVNSFKNTKKPLPDWGEKYYDYLKEFKTSSKTQTLLSKNKVEMKEEYVGEFYTYDNKQAPAMILSYEFPKDSVPNPDNGNGDVVEPTIPDQPVEPAPLPLSGLGTLSLGNS